MSEYRFFFLCVCLFFNWRDYSSFFSISLFSFSFRENNKGFWNQERPWDDLNSSPFCVCVCCSIWFWPQSPSALPSGGRWHRTLRPQRSMWTVWSVQFFCEKPACLYNSWSCKCTLLSCFSHVQWSLTVLPRLLPHFNVKAWPISPRWNWHRCVCVCVWCAPRSPLIIIHSGKSIFSTHRMCVCVCVCIFLSAGKDTHTFSKRKKSSVTFLSPCTHTSTHSGQTQICCKLKLTCQHSVI